MKAFRVLTVATALVTYALVVLGGVVRVSGSGLGCPDWPLCHGRLLPPLNLHAIIEYSHRTTASLASALIVLTAAVALLAWRKRRDIVIPAMVALGLLVAQVVLGAITVRLELPPMIVLAHLATAMALLAAVCVTAVAANVPRLTTPMDRASVHLARAAAAGTYLLILSGSLVVGSGASGSCSAWPLCGGGFSLTFEGYPAIQLLHRGLAAVIGVLVIVSLFALLNRHRAARAVRATVALTLAALVFQVAVGAGALNCWIDRDLDGVMLRTRRRPLPDGRIAPRHALLFGIALGSAAFLLLAFWVNVLAATLAIGGLLFYVFVYTLWLKRWTVQNIVIGGAAGAGPPVVGWSAVTHRVDLTAIYLFAVIFLWTPPHFWALGPRLKGDYARAHVPMLPVVRGEAVARRQILLYTLALVAVTIVVVVTGALGLLYLAGAAVLGAVFIALAVVNLRNRRQRWSRLLFDYSIAYLGLLFAVMVADRMIGRL